MVLDRCVKRPIPMEIKNRGRIRKINRRRKIEEREELRRQAGVVSPTLCLGENNDKQYEKVILKPIKHNPKQH